MTGRTRAQALHQTRFVYYDHITDRVFAWAGGDICDICTPDGDAVDSFLLAGGGVDSVADEVAIQAVETRASEDRTAQ